MEKYFESAYKEALKSTRINDVPVGSVIVKNNKIIAKAHNIRVKSNDVLGHAEIVAIKKAAKKLRTYNLNDCDMYVTLKPCEMCQTIINSSKLKNVYYLINKTEQKKEFISNYIQTNVCDRIKNDYLNIISSFFKKMRNKH